MCGELVYRPWWVKLHFLYVAVFLFIVSVFTTLVISLFTESLPLEHLHRLTFWSRFSTSKRKELDTDAFQEESEAVLQAEIDTYTNTSSKWRNYLRIACCFKSTESLNDESVQEQSKADEEFRKTGMICIRESKQQRLVSTINSIVLMACAAFVIAFFG